MPSDNYSFLDVAVLDEVRQRFAEIHYPAQPVDLFCTFSAGVVEIAEDDDALMMASQADEALYRAKKAGRNQVHGLEERVAVSPHSKHTQPDIV